tara:strand:- start:520 stop:684 length:165 start_codon:yes stop_codon:yes gene_type:complete
MANIKKPRSERKKSACFSIKTKHYEDFLDICSRKKMVFSHEIEEMIINFNNENK